MKHLLQVLQLSILFSLLLACGQPAQFNYLDGSSGRFDQLKGQWTVVNYWAEWCKPCIKEIPELNALDASRDDIVVLGINYDLPERALLLQQARDLNIAFQNIVAAESAVSFAEYFQYDKPVALPTTLIIDPELNVIDILRGPQDKASLLARIEQAEMSPIGIESANIEPEN